MQNQQHIRNFAIISHIDHGKSTLADRLLEITGTVEKRLMRDRFLDSLDLEREHGVTIKMQAARMEYVFNGQNYVLNLIDTPGHVDFGYEVSRALAACEGALLLVDATQGIQAQTVSTAYKALDQKVTLIPVINKIDLPNAEIERARQELVDLFGFKEEEILLVSGKTGEGVESLLKATIERVPAPQGDADQPLRALIFDSVYSQHRGVIAYLRVMEGEFPADQKFLFMKGKVTARPVELGVIRGRREEVKSLSAGEVGYLATGLKDISRCKVGDTITLADHPASESLPGYKQVKPMVFASLFPVDGDDYIAFREALEKLVLNDSSLSYVAENSPALGFGFRVGFLGTFHAEIIKERLEREFNLDLIITFPTVAHEVELTTSEVVEISSPADLPDLTKIKEIKEPWTKVIIMTPADYLSAVSQLMANYRGVITAVHDSHQHLTINCELPLSEIVTNFHNDLKSLSSGYASFDYEVIGFRPVDLVKVDILVHHEPAVPLSRLIVREKAEAVGRRMVEKLKDVLPRGQFAVPLQAAIGGKIIARETLPAYRKDVTAKLYGGDRTRKDKLLKKQAKGKKRMETMGKVTIPKEAFFEVLKA